jgi:MFS family permease
MAYVLVVSVGVAVALSSPVALNLLVAFQLGDVSGALVWVAVFGGGTLGILPVLAGTVTATWDVDPRTPRGRIFYLRLAVIVAATALAGATAMVVVTVVGALPVWVTVAVIGSSVLLTGLSMWLGETVRRRRDQKVLPELTAEDLSPAGVWRRWRRIMIAFAVGFVVGLVGATLALTSSGGWNGLAAFALALSVGCIVAGGVSIGVVRPLLRPVRPLFAEDRPLAKKVTGVVWKGRRTELTAEEAIVATRYAALAVGFLPFQVAQSVLLFVGIAALRVMNLAAGNDDLFIFDVIFITLLGIVTIVTIPISVTRFLRVRRYRDEHPIGPLEPAGPGL